MSKQTTGTETTTPPAKPKKRSAQVNEDITALLKARYTLLWIVTREEQRVENALVEAAAAAKFDTLFWDCATGVTKSNNEVVDTSGDPASVLARIRDQKRDRTLYVLRDLHKWMDPSTLRMVRSLARSLQRAAPNVSRAIVILTPSAEVPPELAGEATVIDYPIPDRIEIEEIVGTIMESLPPERRQAAAMTPAEKDAAVDAAVGLSANEASNCYARSLVTRKKIVPEIVANEKKRVIAREKVLTWYDPDPRGMSAIGGLDNLKAWLAERKEAFGPDAKAYGLQPPKGVMLVGIPGTGKSLTAKCIATAWGMPLLRLDLGALKSKWIGESEANIRRALQVAETVAPCILWADELEKALAGSTGPQGDGGVSSDALGTLLSWMQERQGSVFAVATANDITGLPPELLRKGRFDEIFFLDLPTPKERREIIAAAVAKRAASSFEAIDYDAVARYTDAFTGAEIDAIVPDAMFRAFADKKRPVKTEDLIAAAKSVVPLVKTAEDKIQALREWAATRARRASSSLIEEVEGKGGPARLLDMD